MSSLTHPTLSPLEIRVNVIRCLQAGLVPIVTSSPGMGKSEILQSIADEFNLELLDFRAGQADVTDFNGLPRFTEDGRAEFSPFTDFPLEGDPLPEGKDGWLLFYDELTTAPKQIQAAAYKVLLEKRVGQRKLHKRVMQVAAGNLESDNAVVHSMSTALQSRLIHLELRLDLRNWMDWAYAHDIDSRIIGFLEFRPNQLHNFNPDHQDKTFACPRTWFFTNKLIKNQPISNSDFALLAGTVGPGAATEFITFASIYDQLPSMNDILKNPDTCALPQEPSIKFAMTTVLADHFSAPHAKALLTYLDRLPVECRVLCLRMINARKPTLIRLPEVHAVFQKLMPLMAA